MLISFSVENWQSFREEATLSMVAGREEQHLTRVPSIKNYDLKLLPAAAIYGANASGKTKFFNAISFVKRFIIEVTQPESEIPRDYFKLDKQCMVAPSKFKFELLIENICYEFSFSVTNQKVLEEKLIRIPPGSKEVILYHRKEGQEIRFPRDIKKDKRLRFVAEGTRDNQLFLTNSVDQKIHYFKSIYDWFKHTLVLISPDARYAGDINTLFMSNALSKLDTGISCLKEEEVSFEGLQIPKRIKEKIVENLNLESGQFINFEERIAIIKKNGVISAKKLVPYHKSIEGQEVAFDFKDESAGTLRIMDLLPVFQDLLNFRQSKVYFIDELDRCLHTLVTRNFLEVYFQFCALDSRSQLLFTTHDILLMDQKLFRRDEMWITERDNRGRSSLTSFGEYKDIRIDKDIRKLYLQGQLGGGTQNSFMGKR